jgi:hypothetical protein
MIGHFDPQLTQLIIDEETQASIATVLRQLIRDSQATSGCVLDRAARSSSGTGRPTRGSGCSSAR